MKGCPGPGATGASTLLPMLTLSCFLQPKTPQRPQILISITALVRVSGLFSILENNLGFPHWKASLLPRAQWSKQTNKKNRRLFCSSTARLCGEWKCFYSSPVAQRRVQYWPLWWSVCFWQSLLLELHSQPREGGIFQPQVGKRD